MFSKKQKPRLVIKDRVEVEDYSLRGDVVSEFLEEKNLCDEIMVWNFKREIKKLQIKLTELEGTNHDKKRK